ncbi:MAG: nucleotidyltransferase domain-containing protein [Candidatus Altiarchaeota archaeon]|nr:nucleotidyltransferase domain-containing protein [Candidatus Altiarchaeota archaeon]
MDKRAIAKEFADRLRADLGDKVESVRLFGSVSKGLDTPDSDLDLFVLSKKSVFGELREPIGDVLKRGAVPEVINLTTSEYARIKRLNSPFYRTIENEAVEI